MFVLLGADDVTNLQVTAESKDKEGKAIKTCSFDNVHLVIGKKTIYTGPLYTYKMVCRSVSANRRCRNRIMARYFNDTKEN